MSSTMAWLLRRIISSCREEGGRGILRETKAGVVTTGRWNIATGELSAGLAARG